MYLPSDALSQHLLSYLGFSYLGHGLSLHSCSSKAQLLLLTWEEGYLLTAAPPDLEQSSSSWPSCTHAAATPWTWVLITWTTAFSSSMKLSHTLWGNPRWTGHGGEVWQDVIYWRREWQTTSVLLPWEPHEQYEKTNDRTLKEELPRSVGAKYAAGDQWRNNSRKNEGMEPKKKQYPVVDGTSDRSKVQCLF